MRTRASGMRSAAATTRSADALARPRSAGARTRTLSVSPSQPAMPSRVDDGATLIGSLIVVSCRCAYGGRRSATGQPTARVSSARRSGARSRPSAVARPRSDIFRHVLCRIPTTFASSCRAANGAR